MAKRAGQINEETEFVLKYFHVPAPGYLPDVGTQVKDMDLHETPGAANSMSVKRAWKLMQEHNAVTLPITDKEGKVEGLITTGDIAKSYMDAYDNTLLAQARTQYRSIADTVDGQIIVGNEHGYFIKGKVVMDCLSRIRWRVLLMRTIWSFSETVRRISCVPSKPMQAV